MIVDIFHPALSVRIAYLTDEMDTEWFENLLD